MFFPVLLHSQLPQNYAAQQDHLPEASPPPVNTHVSRVAEEILLNPAIPPSDGSSPIEMITTSVFLYRDLFAHLSRKARAHIAQTCREIQETDQALQRMNLLVSFGVSDPREENQHDPARIKRIETILNSLRESSFLTEEEEVQFCSCTTEEVLQNQEKINALLRMANRNNLRAMISDTCDGPSLTAKLSDEEVAEFFTSFKNRLSWKISCEDENVTNIPEEVFALNPTILKFCKNQITFLSNEIGRLKNLQEINLPHNDFNLLPKVLADLPALKKIYLAEDDAVQIPDSLKGRVFRQKF